LIHVHDTFKGEVEGAPPISDPGSHASRARVSLSEFIGDRELLAIVQHHDQGRAIWMLSRRQPMLAENRLAAVLHEIQDVDTFLAFAIVDGCTPGKDTRSLEWFIDAVRNRRRTRVDRTWILRVVS
jgi:hypothetical protein